jgi:C4-dicarboxylate-specific signal transduction histidine kinase
LPGPWIAADTSDGRILDTGDPFDDMMMSDKKEYLNRPITIFTQPTETAQWMMKPFDLAMLSTAGRHEDVLMKSPAGRTIVVDVHVSKPIRLGRIHAAVCLITDETERHRLQSELIHKHKELRKTFADLERQSQILSGLNTEIGEMSARLSHASSLAALGEITAELTHQLNNPLASAVSAARRIEMFMGDRVDDRVKEMMPLLKDSLDRMKTTMNELKRAYRNSRSADAPMEPVDLKKQIDSALMLFNRRLNDVEVQLRVDPKLPEILGRPVEIQHIIMNLIDNAIIAAGDLGIMRLTAEYKDNRVIMTVSDNGPGVREADRERIFEPFFTTREHGSGLGLSVVRRNVQNNKAAIRVGQSALGGAEFEIGFSTASR